MTHSPSFHARLAEGASTSPWDRVSRHRRSYSDEGPLSCSDRFFEVMKTIMAIAVLIIAAVFVGKACCWIGNHTYKWIEPLLSSHVAKTAATS